MDSRTVSAAYGEKVVVGALKIETIKIGYRV